MLIAFRKSNKITPVLQEMQKILPSWLNELSPSPEDAFYCLKLFSGNCWNVASEVVSEFFQNQFLQTDCAPSNPELPLSYTVAVLTTLWSFVQMFSKSSSSEPLVCDMFSANIIQYLFCQHVNLLSGFLYSSDPVVFSLFLTKLFDFKWLFFKLTSKFVRHIPEGSLFEIHQTLFNSMPE